MGNNINTREEKNSILFTFKVGDAGYNYILFEIVKANK